MDGREERVKSNHLSHSVLSLTKPLVPIEGKILVGRGGGGRGGNESTTGDDNMVAS